MCRGPQQRWASIALALVVVLAGAGLVLGTPGLASAQHTTGFDVAKACAPTFVRAGESVTCTITVTNNDDQHGVENVVITDTVACTGTGCGAVVLLTDGVLAPNGQVGDTVVLEHTFTVTEADCAPAGPDQIIDNVTVAGDDCGDTCGVDDSSIFEGLDATGSAQNTSICVTPGISIVKTAGDAPDGQILILDAPGTVTFTYEVCNTGDEDLSNVVVTDDNGTPADTTDDVTVNVGDLAAGACTTVTADIPVPNPPFCDETRLNTACVVGVSDVTQTEVTDCDDAELCLEQPCAVVITKTVAPDTNCDGSADGSFVDNLTVGQSECVVYQICVENTGGQDLNAAGVKVSDATLGVVDLNFGTITPGQEVCLLLPGDATAEACGTDGSCLCTEVEGTNTATITAAICENQENACDQPGSVCSDTATVACEVGGEGCTPGFWKQPQHFDSWVGHTQTDKFCDVFTCPGDVFPIRILNGAGTRQTTVQDPSLLQALKALGGGCNALARHAVAALLNASNPDVDFGMSEAQVIAAVNAEIADGDCTDGLKDELAELNEQGCPLN